MSTPEEDARTFRWWQEMSEAERQDEGFAHEFYCTLCGIPFWLYSNSHHSTSEGDEDCFAWVSYFFALRILKNKTTESDIEVGFTGVGQWDEQLSRLPPPGYDMRDILKGRRPMEQISSMMTEDEKEQWIGFERIYDHGAEKKYPFRSVYLMHPRCWDICLQQYALVASPAQMDLDLNRLAKAFLQIPLGRRGGGFTPDWSPDYCGPELFWWIDGGVESLRELFDNAHQWHFLQRDPGIACGVNELFINPPFESTADMSGRVQLTEDSDDIFARLPEEVLTEILVLLPSTSVRDLQLASRRMASVHLSSSYWRSRFEFPNELYHITLPPALKISGQVDGQWVDWRRLCDQLLHPAGEKPGWWLNRKRITALNKRLVKSMSLRDGDGRLNKGEGFPSLQYFPNTRV